MNIENVKKIVLLVSIMIFFIIGMLTINEEIIFIVTFIIILITIINLFGEVIKIQIESISDQIYKEFLIVAMEKSLAMHKLKLLSEEIELIVNEIDSLMILLEEASEEIKESLEKEYQSAYEILKHKQLKVLLIESITFYRDLNITFVNKYFNELEKQYKINLNEDTKINKNKTLSDILEVLSV